MLRFLSTNKKDARIIAGGTSLLPDIRSGKLSPSCLVDASHLSNLRYIKHQKNRVRIGALTRIRELKDARLGKEGYKAFARVAGNFGGTAIANMATLGGNLSVASSTSDILPVLLSIDANVLLKSSSGEREISVQDFLLGAGKTDRRPEELITEINFQAPAQRKICLFRKISKRNSMFLAVLSVAIFMGIDESAVIRRVGVAFNEIQPATPGRAKNVESALAGKTLSEEVIEQAVDKLRLDKFVSPDSETPSEYWNIASRNLLREQLCLCAAEISR